MIDARYRRLAQVYIYPDATLTTPSGGRVRIARGMEDSIRIDCDSNTTLWELFDLQRELGMMDSYRIFKHLRSPFLQDFDISVDARSILRWRAGRLPGVASLRGVISWLKARP